MKSSVRDAVLILGILSCGAVTAAAAEIENYGAQGALNSGSSWLGGQVPGLADIAVWDGAGAASAGGWQHVLGDDATGAASASPIASSPCRSPMLEPKP